MSQEPGWWHTPRVPALRMLRQEIKNFEVNLRNTVEPHIKEKKYIIQLFSTVVLGNEPRVLYMLGKCYPQV